jgi:hypothetical protein
MPHKVFFISSFFLDWQGNNWDNRSLVVVKLEQAQEKRRKTG